MKLIAALALLALSIQIQAIWTNHHDASESVVDSCCEGGEACHQEAMTADEILLRMAKAYAGCELYRDSGLVEVTSIEGDTRQTVRRPFTTAFVRPERFRFEFRDESIRGNSRYIVWRKGDAVATWWDLLPGEKRADSLDLALEVASGVSRGSALTIPALLMPGEIDARLITEISGARRVDDTALGERECFLIEGSRVAGDPFKLWLDRESFLVLRIDEQYEVDGRRIEKTTTYDSVIDEPVPEGLLEFNPPNEG